MLVASSIDWTNVLVTLIIAIPAIISAIYAGRIHKQVKTPSGKPIGKQVEDVLHTALSNNYHLQAIGSKVEAVTSPQANGEAGKVEGLTGANDEPDTGTA